MLKEKLGGRWSLKILNYFNCLTYVFLKVFYNLAIIILTWTLIKKKIELIKLPLIYNLGKVHHEFDI